VLRGIARTESRFEPLALQNNTRGLAHTPPSLAAAVAQAQRWLAAGDSIDLGLMQINAANLPALGLTLTTALDPCRSLSGAAAILEAAYARGANVAEQQAALLIALSRYNTGRPLDGLINGYVGKVLATLPDGAISNEPNARRPQTAPNSLPAWNVWAAAAYARSHGAPWLVAASHRPEPQGIGNVALSANPAQIYPTSYSRDDRRSP
ncbi:MAG: transglycosylase SLT domain-containing protein, partial [Pseudomonadota bacterium]|nr:transglycosylase SLT domain-containing protein [Pseudomonadota bacterium]